MTHTEQIMQAVADLVYQDHKTVFSRKEVRDRIGVSHAEWMAGYTAIFQGMRKDQPGGAPLVASRFQGIFHRIMRGRYALTDYGKRVAELLT